MSAGQAVPAIGLLHSVRCRVRQAGSAQGQPVDQGPGHNSVNSLLRNAGGDVQLIIHPRCKTLIKGVETGKLKKGASFAEADAREQHVCTALGYLVHARFPATRPKGMRQLKAQDH